MSNQKGQVWISPEAIKSAEAVQRRLDENDAAIVKSLRERGYTIVRAHREDGSSRRIITRGESSHPTPK